MSLKPKAMWFITVQLDRTNSLNDNKRNFVVNVIADSYDDAFEYVMNNPTDPKYKFADSKIEKVLHTPTDVWYNIPDKEVKHTISQRLYDITKRRMDEREKLLAEHNEKFAAEFAQLKEDCGKEGHVRGKYHNNGLGWEWYYCVKCGGRFDENFYWIEGE